jgi:hypothetical protein
VAATAAPALAYDLRPSKTARLLKDQTHELLTIASFECMKRRAKHLTPDIDSWNCLPDHLNFASDYSKGQWSAILRGKVAKDDRLGREMHYLLAGVRWPDDPTGLARSNVPIQMMANFNRCKKWLEGSYGPCGNRFCQSHFGHLQMAHSMTPTAPWCDDLRPESATCGIAAMKTEHAIEDWVRWLIPVGKGKVGASALVLGKHSFAKLLFDENNCEKVYPSDFTYQSLFFVDCSKSQWKKVYQFWNWGKCDVIKPNEPTDELKARAVGAILHLIQDSYARGHTLRVPRDGSNWCSPRISCTKITKFSDYNEQDMRKHAKADHNPGWDISCMESEREVDDPITAGAKVLAMFDRGDSANEIWSYIAKRVFLTSPPKLDHLRKDKECFGRD